MIDPALEAFGYVGDVSELLFDIFTGGLLTDQPQAKQSLETRLGEWNDFLDGKIFKLPKHLSDPNMTTIDAYLYRDIASYVDAWLTTGKPPHSPRFRKAAAAINEYFTELHYDADAGYYSERGSLPVKGRQKFILEYGLQHLAQLKKEKRTPGMCALPLVLLSNSLAKDKASAAHAPGRGKWGMDR